MPLTHQDWLKPAGDLPHPPGESPRLDWRSLAMRLAGAAACRDALDGVTRSASISAKVPAKVPAASFDPASARRLASYGRCSESDETRRTRDFSYCSPAVNRTDSDQIKPRPVIQAVTAGMLMTGDRGLK